MDLGNAVVSSTAIFMAGVAGMRYFSGKGKNSSNGLYKDITRVVSEKMKDVVYADTCKAYRKGIMRELELTRETLSNGIKEIKEEIRNNAKG